MAPLHQQLLRIYHASSVATMKPQPSPGTTSSYATSTASSSSSRPSASQAPLSLQAASRSARPVARTSSRTSSAVRPKPAGVRPVGGRGALGLDGGEFAEGDRVHHPPQLLRHRPRLQPQELPGELVVVPERWSEAVPHGVAPRRRLGRLGRGRRRQPRRRRPGPSAVAGSEARDDSLADVPGRRCPREPDAPGSLTVALDGDRPGLMTSL